MSAGKVKRQARDIATALKIKYAHAYRLLKQGKITVDEDGTIKRLRDKE